MKGFSYLFALFLIPGVVQIQLIAQNEYILSKSLKFEIERGDNNYELINDVTNTLQFLTERSIKRSDYQITESFCTTISKIQAELDGKSMSDHYITSEVITANDVFITETVGHNIHLVIPPSIGSKFTYSYRENYKDASYFPVISIPNADSIGTFKISIEHPEDVRVSFEFYFPFDSIPYTIDTLDEENIELKIKGIRAHPKLEYFPFNSIRAFVLTTLWKDGVRITPTDIPDFANWYSRKTSLKPKLDSTWRNFFSDSLRRYQDPYHKLRIINDYVRSNVRYIADERGMNAILPRDPSFVLSHLYGDCKDRAALVCALAREQGIDVFMALIPAVPYQKFSSVHGMFFNHVICAYSDSMSTLFFDPTARYSEFGNLPAQEQELHALVLNPDRPRYEYIKLFEPTPSIELEINGHIDSLVMARTTIILRNDARSKALHALKELTEEKLKRFLQDEIGSHFAQLRFDQFRTILEGSDFLKLSAYSDLSTFILRSSERYYVPQAPFVTLSNSILERKSDSIAIYIDEPLYLSCRIALQAPSCSVIRDTIRITSLSRKEGYFSESSQKNDIISFEYRYRQTERQYENENKENILNFISEYLKKRKSMYIISRR